MIYIWNMNETRTCDKMCVEQIILSYKSQQKTKYITRKMTRIWESFIKTMIDAYCLNTYDCLLLLGDNKSAENIRAYATNLLKNWERKNLTTGAFDSGNESKQRIKKPDFLHTTSCVRCDRYAKCNQTPPELTATSNCWIAVSDLVFTILRQESTINIKHQNQVDSIFLLNSHVKSRFGKLKAITSNYQSNRDEIRKRLSKNRFNRRNTR